MATQENLRPEDVEVMEKAFKKEVAPFNPEAVFKKFHMDEVTAKDSLEYAEMKEAVLKTIPPADIQLMKDCLDKLGIEYEYFKDDYWQLITIQSTEDTEALEFHFNQDGEFEGRVY